MLAMSSFELHLLVPGMLTHVSRWMRDYGDLPRCPALETIMRRAHRRRLPVSGIDATLCCLFGLSGGQELALAALRRYGYGAARDAGFWLCADPVHLRADLTQVFLRDGGSLDITPVEAEALAGLFSSHFADEDWRLELGSPAQWHLRLPAASAIKTYPLREVMGKAVEAYLPSGAHAARWRVLLNEMQMLFHAAEVNRARERSAVPTINGLWIWGAGELPERLQPRITGVWANDAVAGGLARLAGVEMRPRPVSFEALLASGAHAAQLVSLDGLLAAASYDDFPAWCAQLQALEVHWFEPMLESLNRGGLTRCHIYDCDGQQFSYAQAHRWRVWRAIVPLQAYAPDV
jgi:hypothetical protein